MFVLNTGAVTSLLNVNMTYTDNKGKPHTVTVAQLTGGKSWSPSDGTGYPDGLRGEEIPLIARIIFACDTFSAITTDRSYRKARSTAEAVAELRRHAGRSSTRWSSSTWSQSSTRTPVKRAAPCRSTLGPGDSRPIRAVASSSRSAASPGHRRPAALPRKAGTGSRSAARRRARRRTLARRQRFHQELQPRREGERLVRLLAAEGDEIVGRGEPGQHVAVGDLPIETSETNGRPSELGMSIASGFVPTSGSPPSGCGRRAGEVAVSSAQSPPSASSRTQ